MYLPDHQIRDFIDRGDIGIDPFDPSCIQPASYDLHLGSEMILSGEKFRLENLHISPGQFLLTSTMETIKIPHNLVGEVHGRSSWARRGLMIHITAGFVDPGWEGVLTLELLNVSGEVIELGEGLKIAQISFSLLTSSVEFPYGSRGLGSHYQGAIGVEGSKD